jgi:hypothetical protein
VFATAGVWTLLVAVRALAPLLTPHPATRRERGAVVALALTASLLVHDVREWLPSGQAAAAYRDLRSVLDGLDGPLYAPWWGAPPAGVRTTSRAHWVALEDRVRGRGQPPTRAPFVMSTLSPVAAAPPPAYLLTDRPLESDPLLSWLSGPYVLEKAFGTRFEAIHELPTRFGLRMPRYLYRRVAAASNGTGGS